MNLGDRLLRKVGLMRTSQQSFKKFDIRWVAGFPTFVDIETRHGQRIVGHIDPFYGNLP